MDGLQKALRALISTSGLCLMGLWLGLRLLTLPVAIAGLQACRLICTTWEWFKRTGCLYGPCYGAYASMSRLLPSTASGMAPIRLQGCVPALVSRMFLSPVLIPWCRNAALMSGTDCSSRGGTCQCGLSAVSYQHFSSRYGTVLVIGTESLK